LTARSVSISLLQIKLMPINFSVWKGLINAKNAILYILLLIKKNIFKNVKQKEKMLRSVLVVMRSSETLILLLTLMTWFCVSIVETTLSWSSTCNSNKSKNKSNVQNANKKWERIFFRFMKPSVRLKNKKEESLSFLDVRTVI
jgi:hypothetical protein